MDKEQLEQEIQKVEEEMARLTQYLSNADEAAADNPAPAQGEEDEEEMTAEEARQNVLAWADQRAFIDDSAVEMTRAQLREVEETNQELEFLISTLDRVAGERRRLRQVGLEQVMRRITRWRHNTVRVGSSINRFLAHLLEDIHEEPGCLTIQSLLNVLLAALEDSPSDPYVRVTREMYPPHLAMLERAGIIAFRRTEDEKHVRMLDLGPDPEYGRLPPPAEGQDTESPTTTTSSQS